MALEFGDTIPIESIPNNRRGRPVSDFAKEIIAAVESLQPGNSRPIKCPVDMDFAKFAAKCTNALNKPGNLPFKPSFQRDHTNKVIWVKYNKP